MSADLIDNRLHNDRLAGRRAKRIYREDLGNLPDGAYITTDDRAWLVWGKTLFAWSAQGYTERRKRSPHGEVDVLTPRSTVAVLAAGYRVGVHPSAQT